MSKKVDDNPLKSNLNDQLVMDNHIEQELNYNPAPEETKKTTGKKPGKFALKILIYINVFSWYQGRPKKGSRD